MIKNNNSMVVAKIETHFFGVSNAKINFEFMAGINYYNHLARQIER